MSPAETIGTPQRGKGLVVAYTGTAGTTAVLAECRAVRVVCTTDAFIDIASDAVAVANTGVFMPANRPEYFVCKPGDKVSAIQSAAGGNLFVMPM